MSEAPAVQRIAQRLIRASCRRLPEDERAERYREWSAELPAILDDTTVRVPILRAVRALRYSAGIATATRQLSRIGGRARLEGAVPVQPMTQASRLRIGLVAWLVCVFTFVGLVMAFPQSPEWIVAGVLGMAAVLDTYCLIDIARAAEVRYLPKWAWVLICLAQAPTGGIAYLCIGRVGRGQSAPPSSAQQS